MVLVLVVHSFERVTCGVPDWVQSLKDAIEKKSLPNDLRIRQVLPTSGKCCTSLWDLTDKTGLRQWLEDNLGSDVCHEIFDVVEEFSYGVAGELKRARAAEKLIASGKTTAGAVAQKTKATFQAAGQKIEELDTRWKVSENTTAAFQSAKTTGAAVLGRIGRSVSQTKDKAMENPRFAATATAVGTRLSTGWKRIGTGFGVAKDQVSKLLNPQEHQQHSNSNGTAFMPVTGETPPAEETEAGHSAQGDVAGQQAATTQAKWKDGEEERNNGTKEQSQHVASSPSAINQGAVFSLGDEPDDVMPSPGQVS